MSCSKDAELHEVIVGKTYKDNSYRKYHGGTADPFYKWPYNGIGEYTTWYWRKTRAKIKRQLRAGIEPPPTCHRHSEKWMYW